MFKKSYNKSAPQAYFSPYTYDEKVRYYKKDNAKVRAKYYNLANKHKDLHKLHIVFTSQINGDRYEIMEHMQIIRSRFNKLLLNLGIKDLYNFENIELGKDYDNPHLDIQLWLNKEDIGRLRKVYNKIIDTYNLKNYRCTFNEYNEEENIDVFHYTVKEYSKDLTDREVYKLGEARKDYRRVLKKRIRFYSHTRNEYSQKIYKLLYNNYGLTYQEAYYVLDNEILQIKEKVKLSLNLKVIRKLKNRHLVYINNKFIKINKIRIFFIERLEKFSWSYWVFGFI